MAKSAGADPGADARGWFGPALAGVLVLTAFRVALLAAARHDLYTDEAQYWLWGQEPAFGYYSKPPLIAWVIALSTWAGGSDAPFWVRLPAPLFHAATALVLGAIAARAFGRAPAIAVALGYATLPMVTVGSLLISTDTVMFPFLAAAIALWLRLLEPGGGGRPVTAAAAGVALGVAFLAKYAALYLPLCAALAALASPRARPLGRDAATAALAFLVTAAPNLAWNAFHGLTTLSHTVDNTGLRAGAATDPAMLLRFLADQFAVVGPVVFPALVLAALLRPRPWSGPGGLFLWLSLPIVGLVSVQAWLAGANANWAAAAYLAGTLAVVPWLLARARWLLGVALVLNGLFALALPLAATRADTLAIGRERPLLARYTGLDELSRTLIDAARTRGASAIVAEERAILADLLYTGRNEGLAVYATPYEGRARHHYDLRFPLPEGLSGPLLYVSRGPAPPCRTGTAADAELATSPLEGWKGARFGLWLVPSTCWAQPSAPPPASPNSP